MTALEKWCLRTTWTILWLDLCKGTTGKMEGWNLLLAPLRERVSIATMKAAPHEGLLWMHMKMTWKKLMWILTTWTLVKQSILHRSISNKKSGCRDLFEIDKLIIMKHLISASVDSENCQFVSALDKMIHIDKCPILTNNDPWLFVGFFHVLPQENNFAVYKLEFFFLFCNYFTRWAVILQVHQTVFQSTFQLSRQNNFVNTRCKSSKSLKRSDSPNIFRQSRAWKNCHKKSVSKRSQCNYVVCSSRLPPSQCGAPS